MARGRKNSGRLNGDVLWYLPGRKRASLATTTATSNLISLLAEQGMTFTEAKAAVHFDPDAHAVLDLFIEHGYGDKTLTDMDVR